MNSRDEAIAQIKAALKKRGFNYSIRGGRGTAWGWITVDLMPSVIKAYRGNDAFLKELYRKLGEAFGLENGYNQISIAASSAHYREYIERAQGLQPAKIAQPYWD